MIVPKEIIRSSRKTIALIIEDSGELIVRVPHKASIDQINGFIEKKDGWIRKKQKQAEELDHKYLPVIGAEGERIPYLGQEYTINIEDIKTVFLNGRNLYLPSAEPKSALIAWLKEQTSLIINESVSLYASLMGVKYTGVKLSGAKGRWGSCSAKNNLNFSWRLIMCPREVIDYVVVHELSHITYKDHSERFWNCIRAVLPDYQQQKTWLKMNRKLMNII